MDKPFIPAENLTTIHSRLKAIFALGNTAKADAQSGQYKQFFHRLSQMAGDENFPVVLEGVLDFFRYAAKKEPNSEGHERAYRFVVRHGLPAACVKPAFKAEMLVELSAYPIRAEENLVPAWEALVRDAMGQDNKRPAQLMINYAVKHSPAGTLMHKRAIRQYDKMEARLSAARTEPIEEADTTASPAGRRGFIVAGAGAALVLAASLKARSPAKRRLFSNEH